MSARTVRAFHAHCAEQGRPLPAQVDINGSWRRPPANAKPTHPAETLSAEPATADPSESEDVAPHGAGELLRVTKARQAADERLAVTLTLGELRELMREAALEAVAEAANDQRPALLDRSGIARALGIGTSTVDRLRREGLPAVLVGDSPRFFLEDCAQWLRVRRATR